MDQQEIKKALKDSQIITPYGVVHISNETVGYLDKRYPHLADVPSPIVSGFRAQRLPPIVEKLVEDVAALAEMYYKTGRRLEVF